MNTAFGMAVGGSMGVRGERRLAEAAAFPLALLMAVASLGGLFIPSLYARETSNWAAQAVGQDWVDLLFAVPWLVVTGALAWKGSRLALLLLAGGYLYTAYTFVIYALGMHFNTMFLIYCATLGVSFFGLAGVVRRLAGCDVERWQFEPLASRVAAYFLMAVGVLFGFAWLSDIVPALFWGKVPASIAEAGTPTNPVYVIDLSVVLPLHLVAGAALLRGRAIGKVLAPVVLAFGVLMALSIAGMIVVMKARGVAANLGVAGGMVFVAVASAAVLAQLVRRVRLN
jgi:hypothetical protein